jgi:hypothetical protein
MDRRWGAALVASLLLSLGLCSAGQACSVCRCGDPLFNSLGTDLFAGPKLRFALDFDRVEKEQGGGDQREKLVERRWTATLAWAPTDRFQLVARLPWSERSQSGADGTDRASGLADPELSGVVRLWTSRWARGLGVRSWLSLVGGLKTDWGRNELARHGERLDEHLQPGTGSRDPFVGLSALYQLAPTSSLYGSVQTRVPGRNAFGYRYGRILLANLGWEKKLGERLDLAAELNARHAGRDQVDRSGTEDPDTGGDIVYVTPRLLVSLGRGLVARASVQVPIWRDLYGAQKERAVVNVGLTFSGF